MKNLSKRCSYCSKALSEYPLIMNDDAGLAVFHAACAAALATDIMVDLSTFFRPPAPYHHLFVLAPYGERSHGEGHMHSTDLEEIKAALWEQAYHPCTQVRWGVAQVMAIRRSRGQLLVQLRGLSRWYPMEAVPIERPRLCPTGACDLEDVTPMNTREERQNQ